MHYNNWRKGNTNLGFIAAGVIIFLLFLVGSFYSGTITGYIGGYKDYNSTQYSTHANKQIEKTCLIREPSAMAECIRIVVEATQEHERSERDIVAQERMSLWALWMAVISGGTFIITGVGVWFVFRTAQFTRATLTEAEKTTKAAQDTIKETKRIGEAQARAYLWFNKEGNPDFIKADEETVSFCFHVKNFGKTPARQIKVYCGYLKIKTGKPDPAPEDILTEDLRDFGPVAPDDTEILTVQNISVKDV